MHDVFKSDFFKTWIFSLLKIIKLNKVKISKVSTQYMVTKVIEISLNLAVPLLTRKGESLISHTSPRKALMRKNILQKSDKIIFKRYAIIAITVLVTLLTPTISTLVNRIQYFYL